MDTYNFKVYGVITVVKSKISILCSEMTGGKPVVYPTDTLYALGADPFNEDAVKKIFVLKRMKPAVLSVAFPSVENARKYAEIPEWVERLLPGPLTIITESKGERKYITENGKIGIRVPDNRTSLELLEKCGPLISTSANIHGHEPLKNIEGIKRLFGDSVLYVRGEEPKYGKPSTIIDITNGLRIIRKGVMSMEKIKKVFS